MSLATSNIPPPLNRSSSDSQCRVRQPLGSRNAPVVIGLTEERQNQDEQIRPFPCEKCAWVEPPSS